ncbi:16699_t:CDS:2, partial [Racocetra persica]
LDNLQFKARTNCQPNYLPSVELQSQYTYTENLQNQISQVYKSLNHHDNTESSPFTANNKYSSNQRIKSGIDPLLDLSNGYGKCSSNHRNEPSIDPLLDQSNIYSKRSYNQSYLHFDEDEFSEDEIFSLL